MSVFKKSLLFCFSTLISISMFFSLIQWVQAEEFDFPDFNQSLMRYGRSRSVYNELFVDKIHDPVILKYRKNAKNFRKIYQQNKQYFVGDKEAACRIPKIVHQIWLGGEVPEKFHAWMNSWMNIQGWEYKLWTDKDVKNFHLYNQKLYDHAKDYGEKSDIFRYEILYKEGGVYVDVDFECLKPEVLERFNQSFDFYAGFEPLEHRLCKVSPLLGNAIIASVPKHPILKKVISDMAASYKKHSQTLAVVSTGPVYLTETLLKYDLQADEEYINLFLPPTVFFPLTFTEARNDLEQYLPQSIEPETIAIHYFSGSWMKPNANN